MFPEIFKEFASSVTSLRYLSLLRLSDPTAVVLRAMAIASISVDFPDPFSPTKKVTGDFNSIYQNS